MWPIPVGMPPRRCGSWLPYYSIYMINYHVPHIRSLRPTPLSSQTRDSLAILLSIQAFECGITGCEPRATAGPGYRGERGSMDTKENGAVMECFGD
jgi:hypothetical protein